MVDGLIKEENESTLRQIELMATRTLSKHIETLGVQIEGLSSDVREVRDKMLLLDGAKLEGQVEALRVRVASLESDRIATRGAKTFTQEFRAWLPAMVVAVSALVFYLKHS